MMTERLKYVGKQLGLVFLLLFLLGLVFLAGLMLGYSVLGNSSNPWDVLSFKTWDEVLKTLTGN